MDWRRDDEGGEWEVPPEYRSSTFLAEQVQEPDEPIPPPPSYRDKWRRR